MAIENAKTLNVRIKNKYDSYENWARSGLVLEAGEIAIAYTTVDVNVDNGVVKQPALLMKVGNGTDTFPALPWLSAKAADVLSVCKDENDLKAFVNDVIANAGIATNDALTALAGRVTTAEGAIEALQTLVGESSVEDQIKAYVESLNLAETYATKEALGDLEEAVEGIDNHSHANKTELDKIADGDKAKWDAVAADHLTSADKATLESSIEDAKKYTLETVTETVPVDTITSTRHSDNKVTPNQVDFRYSDGYCWKVSDRVPPKDKIENGVYFELEYGDTGTSNAIHLDINNGSDIYYIDHNGARVYFVYTDDSNGSWGGAGTYFYFEGTDEYGGASNYISSITVPGFAFAEETAEVEKIKESLIPSKFATQDDIKAVTDEVADVKATAAAAATKTYVDEELGKKVGSIAAGDKSVTVAGTATAPTVAVKLSGDADNAIELAEDGLKVVIPAAAEYSIVKAENSGDYAAIYNLTKDGSIVGASINIPKDMVVESGSVVTDPEGQPAGTYIKLVLANATNDELFIPVDTLIEYVTSGSTTGDMVVIGVSDDHKVTATITDGTITLAKLTTEVQTAIGKAHTHENADVLAGIDANKVAAWDAAEQNAKDHADDLDEAMNARVEALEAIDHSHANATVLDGISAEKVAAWDKVSEKANDADLSAIAKTGSTDDLLQGMLTLVFDCGGADVAPPKLLAAGLYETGAIDLYKSGDVEAAEAMFKTSWDEVLASDNNIRVENGMVYSKYDMVMGEGNFGASTLIGDLVLPNDGSITQLGTPSEPELYYEDRHYAFCECDGLTGIIIPDGVTIVGEQALNRTGCASVIIPGSVVILDSSAFSNCTSLTNVTIPDSVTTIGDYAFSGCTALTNISFEGTIAEWNAIDKRTNWNQNVPATYVQCSDGQVAI